MYFIPEQFAADEIASADTIVNAAMIDADIDAIGRDAARKIAWLVTGAVASACGVLADKDFNETLRCIREDLNDLQVPQARKHFVTLLNHTLKYWTTEAVVPADTFDARMARCLQS